jgi:hypothetical protein
MPPPQIFVSTRSRREYPRRRAAAPAVPLSVLLVAFVVLVWALVAFALWSVLV